MMNKQFKELKIGDRFRSLGIEFIKINDRKYGGPLSRRPANAINLNNNHRVVIGDNVRVDFEEVNA